MKCHFETSSTVSYDGKYWIILFLYHKLYAANEKRQIVDPFFFADLIDSSRLHGNLLIGKQQKETLWLEEGY